MNDQQKAMLLQIHEEMIERIDGLFSIAHGEWFNRDTLTSWENSLEHRYMVEEGKELCRKIRAFEAAFPEIFTEDMTMYHQHTYEGE